MTNSADTPPPLRVYTCYIDGVLFTHTFPHGNLEGEEIELELNRQFNEWLDITAPGAREDGKVTGIRFADMTE